MIDGQSDRGSIAAEGIGQIAGAYAGQGQRAIDKATTSEFNQANLGLIRARTGLVESQALESRIGTLSRVTIPDKLISPANIMAAPGSNEFATSRSTSAQDAEDRYHELGGFAAGTCNWTNCVCSVSYLESESDLSTSILS